MIEAYQEQLIALEELRGRMPQLRKRERPYYRRPARPARRRAARRRDLHQAPREPRRVPRQTGVPTTSLRGTTLSVRSPLWDVGDVGISRLAKRAAMAGVRGSSRPPLGGGNRRSAQGSARARRPRRGVDRSVSTFALASRSRLHSVRSSVLPSLRP